MLTQILLALPPLCYSALVRWFLLGWRCWAGRDPWWVSVKHLWDESQRFPTGLLALTGAFSSFQFYLIFSNRFSVFTRNTCQLFEEFSTVFDPGKSGCERLFQQTLAGEEKLILGAVQVEPLTEGLLWPPALTTHPHLCGLISAKLPLGGS